MAAAATVGVATVALGILTTQVLDRSIVDGVAQTASSSIEALIYPALRDLSASGELTPGQIARLDEVFATSRDAETTRLVQFELQRADGSPIYKADGGLIDNVSSEAIARAAAGETIAAITDAELLGVGPISNAPLRVLRIVTPLGDRSAGAPNLVGILYFSARAITEIEIRSMQLVWGVVLAIGLAVTGALYLVVNRASQLIIGQRSRLAASLSAWQRLAEENSSLHLASEQLRLDAVSANESLLVRVGADMHDGPVQNLTLLILRLSAAPDSDPRLVELAQETLEELRNISSGLVLPELSALTLSDTIQLAVTRHQRWTGTEIATEIVAMPAHVDLAVKICVYRVVQESLSNGHKHGDTGTQRVEAWMVGPDVSLRISNQSARSSSVVAPQADRLGLVGMRLRVEAMGGTLIFELGSSTLVSATIPLSPPRSLIARPLTPGPGALLPPRPPADSSH